MYYTASGIITPVGGRPVHRLRAESALNLWSKRRAQTPFTGFILRIHICPQPSLIYPAAVFESKLISYWI